MKPIMIDFFCGAGGCSKGYSLAGVDVYGIDHQKRLRYPFPRVVMDAVEAMTRLLDGESIEFDNGKKLSLSDVSAIGASPPCQLHTSLSVFAGDGHVDLIPETREFCRSSGKPYIIENVPGAPLQGSPLLLCGSMFV